MGATDLDLARLGLLGDGDLQGEDPYGVAGLDPVGVQVVAEHELSAEDPARSLSGQELGVAGPRGALCPDRDDVAFDVDVDRVLAHALAGISMVLDLELENALLRDEQEIGPRP